MITYNMADSQINGPRWPDETVFITVIVNAHNIIIAIAHPLRKNNARYFSSGFRFFLYIKRFIVTGQ